MFLTTPLCPVTDPNVEYAEPNFIYQKSQVTPNDLFNYDLWGMRAGTAGANAVDAWAAGHQSCDGVVIGVIDTGTCSSC
jgi:hypothetical protein